MKRKNTPTCVVVRPTDTFRGKQDLDYFTGIAAQNVGAQGICMHLVTIPPGGRAKAHRHENHETAIYVLSGAAQMWYGDGLREYLIVRAGEFLYIPAGMPHLPANLSDREPCTAVLARTDPNEQESVVPLPELDGVVAARDNLDTSAEQRGCPAACCRVVARRRPGVRGGGTPRTPARRGAAAGWHFATASGTMVKCFCPSEIGRRCSVTAADVGWRSHLARNGSSPERLASCPWPPTCWRRLSFCN